MSDSEDKYYDEDENEYQVKYAQQSEEEDDEEGYDSVEEYSRNALNKRKRRRTRERYGGFILEEAEEDGDADQEGEAGGDGVDGDYENYDVLVNEEAEVGPTAQEIEQRRRRSQMLWNTESVDELEEYYRRRYADDGPARHFGEAGGGGEQMTDEIVQQTLLPAVKHPNLWMVRCRIGEEKSAVLQLMTKFLALESSDDPLQIKSVVSPEGIKGYIYIESYKKPHVVKAVYGISILSMGWHQQQMVPVKEMADVMSVVKDKVRLQSGSWVRLKKGVYKDDIAQIDYVNQAALTVHLKLIPRIDYTRKRGVLRATDKDNGARRRSRGRFAQKLLDIEKIRSIGGELTQDGDFVVFENNRYSRKGFLYKNFPIKAIRYEGVKPTLSELSKFETNPDGVDLNLSQSIAASGSDEMMTQRFATGDNVMVHEGDLINLQGRVIKVESNLVTIMPKHEELKDPLEFPASSLRKYFVMGDHVRVIAGSYEGDTGLVVRVEERLVILFSDLTMHELRVLPGDLQLCSDTATGLDSLGHFQYGDMVQLDAQTVGVIVRLERECLHVLNMHGTLVRVRPQAVIRRRNNRNDCALDSEQNNIQRRDVVKVIDGQYSGYQGQIKHIYRSFAFLYSRLILNNGGIFICRTRHLLLPGGNKSNSAHIDGMMGFMSPRITSPAHNGTGAQTAAGMGGVNDNMSTRGITSGGGRTSGGNNGASNSRNYSADRQLVGKTVKITAGPYKSNVGMVKAARPDSVRVELHSDCKTITVARSNIQEIASKSGGRTMQQTGQWNQYSTTGANTPTAYNQRTPQYMGGATPLAGGLTPTMGGISGSATPIYQAGRTPLYEQSYGAMTPVHDGAMTPRGAGSSGAWDPSVANTPARDYEAATYSPLNDPSHTAVMPSPSLYTATPSPSMGPGTSGVGGPMSGAAGAYHSSPGTPYSPASSHTAPYSPLPMYGTPHQLQDYTTASWISPDLQVCVISSPEDPALLGAIGVVRTVYNSESCSVLMLQNSAGFSIASRVVDFMVEALEPVKPQSTDRFKVISPGHKYMNSCGTLISIDDTEGVVQLDIEGFNMLTMKHLCKLHVSDG